MWSCSEILSRGKETKVLTTQYLNLLAFLVFLVGGRGPRGSRGSISGALVFWSSCPGMALLNITTLVSLMLIFGGLK